MSRTLQWILYWPHRPCAYESRAPRRTRPGKAAFVHTGLWQASSLCSALYDDIPCFTGNASGPLFLVVNERPLTRTILTDWLGQIMTSAQIPDNFSSHSFCIGAATVTARNGILNQWAIGPTTLISLVLGHWPTH